MVSINSTPLQDFSRFDKDKDGLLNKEKDKIEIQFCQEYFIADNGDIDYSTFYQLNADKYGEKVQEEYLEKREEIHQKYQELNNKAKPTMGITNSPTSDTIEADIDTFFQKPENNTHINYIGYKIVYKDEAYSVEGRNDIPPNKNIYGITYQIKAEKREKTETDFKNSFENATTPEEKRKAIDNMLEDLLTWHNTLQPESLKANYSVGTELHLNFCGYNIRFTIGEDYKPIINKENLYQKAGCGY